MNLESNNKSNQELWKAARTGVILFCVIHFLFEIAAGNIRTAMFPVIINYTISQWYIEKKIVQGKVMDNLLLMGFYISCVVFLIRIALGVFIYLSIFA